MERYNLNIKEIELEIHQGNYNRRVKYSEKDFDFLVVSLQDDQEKRYFAIPVNSLSDKDSIHLIYAPLSRGVRWSPYLSNVVEITKLYKGNGKL